MGINKEVRLVHPVRGEKRIPFPFSIRIRVAFRCVAGWQSFRLLSLCFLDLLKSLRSSFGAGPEKLEVNLNSSVDKTELRRVQRDRQLCRWKVTLMSEKYFIWIGWECYQQHRELALEPSAQGLYLLSHHPFPLLFPEPGTGPVIAWCILLSALEPQSSCMTHSLWKWRQWGGLLGAQLPIQKRRM